MAAVLGGAQIDIHGGVDENRATTEFQQSLHFALSKIIAYESGISKSVDPLGAANWLSFLKARRKGKLLKVLTEIGRTRWRREGDRGWVAPVAAIAERAYERKNERRERRPL